MTAPAIGLELRPYQEEALDKTAHAEHRGVRRQLGVAATGLGKTVMFSALAQRRAGRTLILVHREELVRQAAAKIREIWPGVDVGVVKGTENEIRSQVVIASVQTLSRPNRLERLMMAIEHDGMLGPVDRFDMVIIDEAHHAAATSYRSILDRLDAGAPDGPLLLGVTATPDRGDGRGLDDLFDEIVWSYDIRWGIRAGFLSDLRGKRVTIDALDLSSVRVSRGDYQVGDAGRALTDAGAPDAVVAAWIEHALGRRTLAFWPTVEAARQCAVAFTNAGVRAGFVSGETPIDERRRVLEAYSCGEIDVLANCAVLTEGYDEPRTDCIIVARPTQSRALYTQMVGRGTRRHPDKIDCLVLDVVGATEDHSLVTIPALFGVTTKKMRDRLGDGSSLAGDVLDEYDADLVRVGKLTAAEAELFHKMRRDGIAWISIHDPGEPRRYHRPLGKDQPTVVIAEVDGVWKAGLIMPNRTKQVLHEGDNLEIAQGVAEDYVRSHGRAHLTEAGAGWRTRKPSPKALGAARKWRLTIDPTWNAGQLSDALDRHIEKKRARQ